MDGRAAPGSFTSRDCRKILSISKEKSDRELADGAKRGSCEKGGERAQGVGLKNDLFVALFEGGFRKAERGGISITGKDVNRFGKGTAQNLYQGD